MHIFHVRSCTHIYGKIHLSGPSPQYVTLKPDAVPTGTSHIVASQPREAQTKVETAARHTSLQDNFNSYSVSLALPADRTV